MRDSMSRQSKRAIRKISCLTGQRFRTLGIPTRYHNYVRRLTPLSHDSLIQLSPGAIEVSEKKHFHTHSSELTSYTTYTTDKVGADTSSATFNMGNNRRVQNLE